MKTKLALITFGIISVQCIFANSSTWEQWRGPNRNGIVEDQSFEWPKNLKGIEKVWSKSSTLSTFDNKTNFLTGD